jgi:hypothetical protein
MQPVGMRLLIQRERDGDFTFVVPKWIGDRLGDLLLMQYDGDRLTISPAGEIE